MNLRLGTKEMIKIWYFCIFKMATTMAKNALNCIFSSLQSKDFIVWVSTFQCHSAWSPSKTYVNLSHLHIQYGHQSNQIMLWKYHFPVYSPQILLKGLQFFICVSDVGPQNNNLISFICIYSRWLLIAVPLYSKQNIAFVNSFSGWKLNWVG